ncbi:MULTISPECIES: PilW family protein [Exiguobacterium]|uniref:Prepilin-type N-terminal cleavage/methylation domain-containing protein n=1 Tax=Exiguobacterium antarcticum TaxID=132920 RepID=A0ABT6R0M9_9BACL|nr:MULTISPECIES: prepilin-type N-terminal cleavage/methylation domain-containing protein [Exiguobacterium]MCT4778764.1 prepilin-type N-terminal cleavage/methylation domain-containing protein [Exiguobacterium soli]MDI3234487.1 prepilin-type N-terminal cleavage/methylation domain-containing protein [Exiguobacterium antarcticum]
MRRLIKVFPQRNDGFSLVELLVAIVIAAIFSAVILTVFISGTKSFQATGIISELRSEADSSVGLILNEITGFDAIRIDQANKLAFYKKTLPSLSQTTGLLERSAGFVPYNANQEDVVEPVTYKFDDKQTEQTTLIYNSPVEIINEQTSMQKAFTLSRPETVTITTGDYPGVYVVHGILTITLTIQSNDQEETQTLTSTIGF